MAGNAPPARTPESPPVHIPSLGYRILVAGLRIIPAFLVLIAIPAAALTFVNSHGVSLPISVYSVTVFGIALLAIGAAQYVLKPTVAYGPLTVAYSSVVIVYLYYASTLSPYHLSVPGGTASIAAGFALFLYLLMVVPAFGVIAGVLTTVEDVRDPRERLPFDFPG